MRTPRFTLPVCVLALSVAAPAQSIDWIARFDDIGAASDNVVGTARTSTGALAVLAERTNHGTILFTVDPNGDPIGHTTPIDSDDLATWTFRAGPDDSVVLAALRRDAGGRQAIVVLLRLGAGDVQWSEHSFDSPWEWERIEDLAVDTAGNVLISGPTVDGDGHLRLAHVSFDPQAAVRWATQLAGETLPPSAKTYVRASFDGSGNAYVVATVEGQNGSRDGDLLVIKYDLAGQSVWTWRFDLASDDTTASYKPSAILADDDGVFVCAYGSSSSAGAGIISIRLDAGGTPLWQDFFQGGTYYPRAKRNPADGGYYVASEVYAGSPRPKRDFLLLRYGPDGQRLFSRQLDRGAEGDAYLSGIVVEPDGQVVMGGSFVSGFGSDSSVRAARVSTDGVVLWDRQYSWSGADPWIWCRGFLADSQGRATFVASVNDSHTGRDAALLTLDAGGEITRIVQLNSTQPSVESFCYGSVADLDGNLYLALNSRQYPDTGGWVVVKYDASGIEQWRRRVSEWGSRPTVMAIDAWQNITVAGSVADNGSSDTGDILVVRWRPDGSEVWRAVYDGPTGQRDYANGMAMSYMGDVYVSGQTVVGDQGLPLLIKFDYNGHYQWDQLAIFGGRLMKVASDDNLLLITSSGLTCMSPDGWIQWTSPLPASNGCSPTLYDMALDRFGNVVLVGRGCFTSTSNALAVIKYSPTGELRWVSEPGEIEGAIGQHLVLDRPGNVLVTGTQSVNQGSYPPDQFLVTALVSPQGATRWTARHYLGPAAFSGATDLARDDQWAYVMSDYENVLLFRYDLEGNLAWKAEYEESDASRQRAFRLSLDSDGRPNITSTITSVDNNSDIVTVCYGAAPPPCGGTPACRAADVNADCAVDLADLFIVLSNFGLTHRGSISPADGDMNFDGVTDINDLVSVLGAFGLACE